MIIYRLSGEGLLRLVNLAAAAPGADVDTILGIVHGADIEESGSAPPEGGDDLTFRVMSKGQIQSTQTSAHEPGIPDIGDGPSVSGIDVAPVKPVKPE